MLSFITVAAEQITEQAPEAVKQVLTNENAVGYLASALNAVSDTLTATVGENPYARAAAAATTAVIGLGTAYLAFSSYGKRKAAEKPSSSATPTEREPVKAQSETVQPQSESVLPQPTSSDAALYSGSNNPSSHEESDNGEVVINKSRSRSPSPTGRGDE